MRKNELALFSRERSIQAAWSAIQRGRERIKKSREIRYQDKQHARRVTTGVGALLLSLALMSLVVLLLLCV
jgi:hypothetical protein